MDPRDVLRRMAVHQLPGDTASPGRHEGAALDARTTALVRLAALVAMGGVAGASYGRLTDEALSAGAQVEEIVGVLLGVLPVVGPARVVAAAPALGLALGYDIDDLPDA